MVDQPIRGNFCRDYGKRFQRLEVFPVGEKGEVWGGGSTDLQILGFQMGVEEVQKTL